MKKMFIFTTIILFLSTGYAYPREPSKASWGNLYGPQYNSQDHYVFGGSRIRFWTGFAFPRNWKNEYEIGQIARDHILHSNICHVSGITRWTTIPEDNSNTVFILAWYNLDNNDFGWTAVKNTRKHWYVASSQNPWTTQARYTRDENMYFRWQTNRVLITIKLRNPNNENGWTSKDIWYTFYWAVQ